MGGHRKAWRGRLHGSREGKKDPNSHGQTTQSPNTDEEIQRAEEKTSAAKMATLMSLPAELRILIWQYSMPEPRRPVLSWSGNDFDINTTPPNLVHVCHESRQEAAKQYELAFPTPDSPAHIWFDFERDYLYVTDEALAHLSEDTVARITNLRHFRYTGKMALKCSS